MKMPKGATKMEISFGPAVSIMSPSHGSGDVDKWTVWQSNAKDTRLAAHVAEDGLTFDDAVRSAKKRARAL